MGVAEWWWGDPDRADEAALRGMLARAPSRLRIAAALALARLGRSEARYLADPVPGVRRMTARGLGWAARERGAMEDAFVREPTETVKVALGASLLRCGAPESAVLGGLRPAPLPLRPSIPGLPSMRVAVWWELGRIDPGPPPSRDEVLSRGRQRLEEDPRQWLPAIASLGPPWLLGLLPRWEAVAGRREDHALLDAIGWLGDPRARPRLITALERMDIDPGRHGAERRIAAQALGRLGDPASVGDLAAAIEREAVEFEGRPGAGLGVQAPVRAVLLWALGELQSGGEILAEYLGESGGAGLGAAAMDALRKHGMVVEDLLVARSEGPSGPAARAVLAAIGSKKALDPRDDADVREGIAELRGRRWFEAHEAFERAWKHAHGDRRRWLQALVHMSVALEHRRRGAGQSAQGQWRKSQEKRGPLPAKIAGAAVRRWTDRVDALFESSDSPAPEDWPVPEETEEE